MDVTEGADDASPFISVKQWEKAEMGHLKILNRAVIKVKVMTCY